MFGRRHKQVRVHVEGGLTDAHAIAQEVAGKVHRRFRYWIKRPQEHGGNLSGECWGITITRCGAVLVHGDHGRLRWYAPGTWLECESSRAGEVSGGE